MRQKIIVEELRDFAEKFVADEPGRLKSEGWWQKPLLANLMKWLFQVVK